MALNNAQKIFNLIRLMGSKMYQDTVPALTDKSPIGDVGTPILSNPVVFKEFSTLLGALMRTEVLKKSWTNPLAELIKTNGQPLGEYSAEVANNPVAPQKYDANHPEKVLEYAMLSDKVAYYARNVKEKFKVSIAYEDMKGAFSSYDNFNDYVSMKMAALTSGQQISQFNHIFEAIVANYNAGLFVESDIKISPTSTNYADWTTAVKTLADRFTYPSTEYNNYGNLAGANGKFRGWTNPEDIYIIMTIDWANRVDVNFLASLFNITKAEIAKRIIKVPAFAYDLYDDDGTYLETVGTPIQCMVCDRNMFKFSTDLEIDDSFYNPETLVENHYKHWWATYAISPFANCVIFTNSDTERLKITHDNLIVQNGDPATFDVVNTGASISGSTNFTINYYEMYDSDGNIIEFKEPAQAGAITDVDEAFTVLCDGLASNIVTATIDNTLKSTYEGNEISKIVSAGSTTEMVVARTATTNMLNQNSVTIDDDIYTISDEVLEAVKAKYGNDPYISVMVEVHRTASPRIDYAQLVYVGLRNKAIINVK